MTPDVVARFDSVHLEQEGPDRVRVTGARGEPAPEKLKVSSAITRAGARSGGSRCPVRGVGKSQEGRRRFWEPPAARARTSRRCSSSSAGTRVTRRLRRASPAKCSCSSRCATRTSARSTRVSRHIWCRAPRRRAGHHLHRGSGAAEASEVVAFWPALVSPVGERSECVVGERRDIVHPHPICRARGGSSAFRSEADCAARARATKGIPRIWASSRDLRRSTRGCSST